MYTFHAFQVLNCCRRCLFVGYRSRLKAANLYTTLLRLPPCPCYCLGLGTHTHPNREDCCNLKTLEPLCSCRLKRCSFIRKSYCSRNYEHVLNIECRYQLRRHPVDSVCLHYRHVATCHVFALNCELCFLLYSH